MASFDEAFVLVVGSEGGYANNPADPGGETHWGVSKRSYPALDIKNLTIDQAKAIYERDYWAKVGADKLPPPLALVLFDAAVNNGPSRAARWLQQAVGVPQDGVVGPLTLAAVAKHQLADTIAEFQARRSLYMLTLPTVGTFGLGWARRLVHVSLACMAFEDKPPPAAPAVDPPSKLTPADLDAIEVAVRKALEDGAYTAALNQRPSP
jgi:lysozyme family protein